jgi:hypothetical protein
MDSTIGNATASVTFLKRTKAFCAGAKAVCAGGKTLKRFKKA